MRRGTWAIWTLIGAAVCSGCTRTPADPCRGVAPPVATFCVSPEGGELPVVVTFDASDSLAVGGPIVEYAWDFGDGATGSGRIVRHKFEAAPDGAEEREFRVTLTVVQRRTTEEGFCELAAQATRVLRYGIGYPLNVLRWELKPVYNGSLLEGVVRNESADRRVTHAEVHARFYREPGHAVVGEARRELWDIRPGEERVFLIWTPLRRGEFDWVELQTAAFTAEP